MTLPQNPQEHEQFDSLVAEIDDYEPLPEISTRPDVAPLLSGEAQSDSIDAEILAGLVTP
jgi:hypothetical protein